MIKQILYICLIINSFSFFFIQAQPTLNGYWQGKLKVGEDSLRLVFQFKDKQVFLISPDQGSPPIEMEHVWDRDTLSISNKNLMAGYEGIYHAQDSTIYGFWKQGGRKKLVLKKIKNIEPKFRPQNPSQIAYIQEEVHYKNIKSGLYLAGTLTLPHGKGPFPAVILISGSGPQDRNEPLAGHYPFWVLSDYLTQKGIAVLRYDDRGVGDSEGKFDQATIHDFYTDAQAGIEYLYTRNEVDTHKIGVIGHSEGGWIAQMLATRSSGKPIAFAISLAGPGVPGDSLMRLQGPLILKSMGIADSTLKKYKIIQGKLLDIATSPMDSIEAMNRAGMILADYLTTLSPAEQIQTGMSEQNITVYSETMLSPWFRTFLRFKPELYLSQIQVPYFALNGNKDIQVPAKENLSAIQKYVPKNFLTTKSYKNRNHLFQTCQSCTFAEYSSLDETLSVQVMNDILKWIQKITKTP